LFLGAEKHAMDFNFIFSISQKGEVRLGRKGRVAKISFSDPGSGG
jgi:hypothetical protein